MVGGVDCFVQWALLSRVPCGPESSLRNRSNRSKDFPWRLSGEGPVARACSTILPRKEGSWRAALVLDIGLQVASAQQGPWQGRATGHWRPALLWHLWDRDWCPQEVTWHPELWTGEGATGDWPGPVRPMGALRALLPPVLYGCFLSAVWLSSVMSLEAVELKRKYKYSVLDFFVF